MKNLFFLPLLWSASLFLLVSFGAVATSAPIQPEDPPASLKSKDAGERLVAARAAIAAGGEDLTKVLRKLLKDKDWEVAILATGALGEVGSEKDVDALVKIASSAPITEWRATAALALGKLDAPAAAEALFKKLRKATARPACEALILLAPQLKNPDVPKALMRLLKEDEADLRASAGGALVALERTDRGALLSSLLASEYLSVHARVLEVIRLQPHTDFAGPLRELLLSEEVNDVILRRALPAYVACTEEVEASEGAGYKALMAELAGSDSAPRARRAALLAELIIHYGFDLVSWTSAAREHADAGVRAGAVRLLGLLKGDAPLEACLLLFQSEPSERVRLAALKAILSLQPVTSDAGREWAIKQLPLASEPSLREVLAVELGDKGMEEHAQVAEALIVALEDPSWAVAACAAVSLGLTRNPAGVLALASQVTEHEDWRMRGAAVVGLTKALQKDGIPALIAALKDPEPLVARTALSYMNTLRRGDKLTAESKEWTPWWDGIKDKMRLYDPREQRERNAKYGYTASPEVIYRDLDVLVLNSRGDHIQWVLERFGIEHRLTQAEHLSDDGLDAGGVFVSNCTGEMGRADLERLHWFVKVGGYLTGSCWALTETIAHLEPGVLAKIHTNEQVLDNVVATPCDVDSQYTQGVFGKYVSPIYRLEGAHIIDVLQPERIQMLVDSAACAERWGGGNLACWFKSGHGTILDSANHFDSPVFQHAKNLKKPEQRMAYAVNHMGTTYERIRESAKEKFWSSNHKAAANVFDDSVFRLVTNFVRLRRLEGR